MQVLSNNLPAVKLGAQLDQKPSGSSGYALVPLYEEVTTTFNASSSSLTAYVASNAPGAEQYQLVGVSVRFGTASSSGTLQIEVAGAGVAVGSGTNQLTGTVSLAGTANTTVNGTIISSPTAIAAGSAVNIILGGTLTSLANAIVTIVLQRIA